MQRLDSLSVEELKKLYIRSSWFYQVGLLLFLGGVLYLLLCVLFLFADLEKAPLMRFPICAVFGVMTALFGALAYVYRHVRTHAARIFFYIISISNLVLSALGLLGILAASADVGAKIGSIIGMIIGVLIQVELLKSAKTDLLFTGFTHKQIAFARKKSKRKELFTDEELPVAKPPKKVFSAICLVLSYIWLAVIVLAVIGECIMFFSKPLQK